MSRRAGFLAFAAGTALGMALGLVYAWLIDPVDLYNTTPDLLRSDYRHDWIRLTALAYLADGDMERVEHRLSGLPQQDIQEALAALIESYAEEGKPARLMRPLSQLAFRLGVRTTAMLVYLDTPSPPPSPEVTPTPAVPSPTPEPPPTATPTPFRSPLPPVLPYRVISQTQVCDSALPRLQVLVRAAPEKEGEKGTPLPGVVLWLTWPGGADRAVTGLRPEIDLGYADFTLEPGVSYALSVEEPAAPLVSGLTLQPCPKGDGIGSWRIVIEINPPPTANQGEEEQG
ncbi:MAG TPA: hypothetical protein ENK08_09090 [Chloroflexi bacterium]|nr:hypothetical protein [Chloroflexota bacterium]